MFQKAGLLVINVWVVVIKVKYKNVYVSASGNVLYVFTFVEKKNTILHFI